MGKLKVQTLYAVLSSPEKNILEYNSTYMINIKVVSDKIKLYITLHTKLANEYYKNRYHILEIQNKNINMDYMFKSILLFS